MSLHKRRRCSVATRSHREQNPSAAPPEGHSWPTCQSKTTAEATGTGARSHYGSSHFLSRPPLLSRGGSFVLCSFFCIPGKTVVAYGPQEMEYCGSTKRMVTSHPRAQAAQCSAHTNPLLLNQFFRMEDQIAMSLKFLERAKKRLAVVDTELQAAVKKNSQCEQEIAKAEADLARMREEHSASGEEPKTEVQQLRARVAQLEEFRGRHVRVSEEAAEHIRTMAAQNRDALDMADMESASAITSLITRGLAKMASFVPQPSAPTWCREESDRVGIQGHQGGRGVPPRASQSRKFVGGCVSGS